MSEPTAWADPTEQTPDDQLPGHQLPGTESTGDARVDAVLASLEPLETAPVAEHVTVFESAIAQLRSALDGAGSPAA